MQIQEWTPAQIEYLTALASKGYSDKEITAKLNAKFSTNRSRSSVIGKAKREGIRIASGRRYTTAARASKRWAYAPGPRP